MSNRKWIFGIATALLSMVIGLSAYAAGNDDLLSNPNAPTLLSSNLNTNNNLSTNSANSTGSDPIVDYTDAQNVYKDYPNDYSIKYMNMLFGNVGNTLRGSVTGQTVGMLFKIFNQGILIACGIWVLLTLWRIIGKLLDGNVQEISKEGKTFLSICLGIVLVIPSPSTGYSTIQSIIMKVVVQGVKLANGIWDYQINAFENHVHVFDNPPQQQNWVNSEEDNKPEYQFYHIMAQTIPGKVDAGIYSILRAEINYYQSKINCTNNGSEACGANPHPLIAQTGDSSTKNISTITLNQSYPQDSAANPVVFSARMNEDIKGGTDVNQMININPFAANLQQVVISLQGTALGFVCQSNPDSPACESMPPVDLSNSANIIIGLSTQFAGNISNVYGLDQLQNDKITDNDNIATDDNQCYARWMKEGETNPAPSQEEIDKYNQELAEYNAKKNAVQDKIRQLENNDIYKKYNDKTYKDDYDKAFDSGCLANISCNMNAKDYMGIGDLGGWGKEDTGGWGKEDYDKTLDDCSHWIVSGRRRANDNDYNQINGGYNTNKVTEKDGRYYDKSTGEEIAFDLSATTGNIGPALYPTATPEQAKVLCQNFGSILYQVWRDSDSFDVREGMNRDAKNAYFEDYLPSMDELNGLNPPKYPEIKVDPDKDGRQTCTQVLADKMRNSGWIMAGAYYWLIAHQDQQMVTKNANKSQNYIDYSPGRKYAEALSHFTLTNDGGIVDNNISDGDGADNQAALDSASCAIADGSKSTVDNLKSCVLANIKQQFKDNGADIGQIDTKTDSPNGISSQLAWAGNAFNAVISGETDAIDAAPQAKSVKDETTGYSSSNQLGKYGKSALGVLYQAQASLFPQLMNQIYYMQRFILNVASQLNNPNLDPQSIIASIGMGMIYQGGYATLGYIHMMITLVIVVIVGVVIIAVLLCIPYGIGGVAAAVTGAPLAILMTFAKVMGGILRKIGTTFMFMGAVMAFYVPIYPWIVFTFAVVGWFIAVIESMAAGPLICLGMTHPQGQELANSLKQSMMLLLSVFIRPALIVLSFIMSMILARVLLFFMIQGFLMLLGTLYDSNTNDYCRYIFNTHLDHAANSTTVDTNKASCNGSYGTSINLWSGMFNLGTHAADIAHEQYSDTIKPMDYNILSDDNIALNKNIPLAYRTNTGLDGRPDANGYRNVMQFIMMMLSMPILLGVLTYMTYKIINHAYSLVFLVPENVLKWIGAQSAGNTQQLMGSAEGSKDFASKAGRSGAKAGDQVMRAGEAQATAPIKAGGSAAMQGASEAVKGGAQATASKNKK